MYLHGQKSEESCWGTYPRLGLWNCENRYGTYPRGDQGYLRDKHTLGTVRREQSHGEASSPAKQVRSVVCSFRGAGFWRWLIRRGLRTCHRRPCLRAGSLAISNPVDSDVVSRPGMSSTFFHLAVGVQREDGSEELCSSSLWIQLWRIRCLCGEVGLLVV
jgi:hypothetical protein